MRTLRREVTRPTPTDNRQRRSGCERTNRNYLNCTNRPTQLAKQSARACISTEPRPGRLRLLPFGRLGSQESNQFLPGICLSQGKDQQLNSENHEVQPRHLLANRSGAVLALATLHCSTEWRTSSSAASIFSEETERCSSGGYPAGAERDNHSGFCSNRKIAECACKGTWLRCADRTGWVAPHPTRGGERSPPSLHRHRQARPLHQGLEAKRFQGS
jgi:hypothetical protein